MEDSLIEEDSPTKNDVIAPTESKEPGKDSDDTKSPLLEDKDDIKSPLLSCEDEDDGKDNRPDTLFGSLIRSIKAKIFGEDSTLSWFTSTMIMVSLSYGSAVVILPYTMSQLGPIVWTVYTASIIAVLAFCTVLLKECCVHIMGERADYAMLRHPYQKVAELVVGKAFSKCVMVTLSVCMVSSTLAYILLAATCLNSIIPTSLDYYSNIRIWIIVCFFISLPFMLSGSYSDMQLHAVFAVSTSFIAMVCILTLSVMVRYYYDTYPDELLKTPELNHKHFFIIFGDITFAVAGPALALPNIIVLVKSPERFHRSIIFSHIIVFLIYITCATVPYAVFDGSVAPTVTDTLSSYFGRLGKPFFSNTVLIICQTCIAAHFILVSILSMNPVFLMVESSLNVPMEFNWKRVLLRIVILIAMLIFCVAVPYFSPILSMVGAVPETALTIIIPIIIYLRLFETSIPYRSFLMLLICLATCIMVGNTVFSISDIISLYKND